MAVIDRKQLAADARALLGRVWQLLEQLHDQLDQRPPADLAGGMRDYVVALTAEQSLAAAVDGLESLVPTEQLETHAGQEAD